MTTHQKLVCVRMALAYEFPRNPHPCLEQALDGRVIDEIYDRRQSRQGPLVLQSRVSIDQSIQGRCFSYH